MLNYLALVGTLATAGVLIALALLLRRLGFEGGAALILFSAVAGLALALAGVVLATF